jgi:hypothetical protein
MGREFYGRPRLLREFFAEKSRISTTQRDAGITK